jgi:hypothetical protein
MHKMNTEKYWKLLTLISFMLSVIIFSYLRTVDNDNPRFPLKWNQSAWLTTEGESASGYYRSEIDLATGVDRAVIQIAATDNFQFYINGKKVDTEDNKSTVATGVYDVSHLLNVGKNVLAVSVQLKTYPSVTGLRYEIQIVDKLGRSLRFQSSQKDKAQSILPSGNGEVFWYDVELDSSEWPQTKVWAGPDDVSLIGYDPEMLITLPKPRPLSLIAPQSWNISAQNTFWFDPETDKQVWLGFSSDMPYEIVLNDITIGHYEAQANKLSLQAIRSRLVAGENTLKLEILTSGSPALVSGGVIIRNQQGNKYVLLDNEWSISGAARPDLANATNPLGDQQSFTRQQHVFITESSTDENVLYAVLDTFVPPRLVQKAPWLTFGKYVFALISLLLLFRALGLSTIQLINGTVMANLIGILCLLIAWFVAQDIRFDARIIFSENAMSMLLLIWFCMVIASLLDSYRSVVISEPKKIVKHDSSHINNLSFWFMAVAIVVVAFMLRFDDLALRPLTVDESTIAGFARGVMERGYPYLMVGGMEIKLATYELVPYALAASLKLLGYGDFGLRFPALMFGVMTCGLVIFCGSKWFGKLAGLVAGLLYAVSPWAIYWGQNAFHPAQTQFFNMLSLIVFYRLLMADRISLRLALLSAFAFSFTYLSWEGAGMVLPIMALVAFVVRWRQWQWFAQVNLWTAGLLILFVVVAQGIRRTMLESAFTKIGFGKSETVAPSLTFTEPTYEPLYYLNNFFFTENHISLTLFFVIGFILMFYDKKLSFVVLFVTMAYLTLTNMLGFYNAHYFYFVLPVFLIAVAAVFIKLLMLLQSYFTQIGGQVVKIQGILVAVLLAILLIVPSSTDILHMYRLQQDNISRLRVDYRDNLAAMDMRLNSEELGKRLRKDDIVISNLPLMSEHYTQNKADYFLQTITNRKVVYDTVRNSQFYADKFVGNPVLRTKQEFQEVLERHSRVFFIAAPIGALSRLVDDDTMLYINQNMRVVAESYDSRLYLWEK